MTSITQAAPNDPVIRAAGGFAIISGIISALGVVLLLAMFICFATPYRELELAFGLLNDICVALQYLLTIPIALALYRILLPHNPTLIRIATVIGIVMMLIVVALQMLLVFGVLPFEKQVLWVSLAMIVGVGLWLIITGIVAKTTGSLPNSVMMSVIAVPYLGYPVWAFWLGRRLLGWQAARKVEGMIDDTENLEMDRDQLRWIDRPACDRDDSATDHRWGTHQQEV